MQIKVIAIGSTGWERFIRRWGLSFLIGKDLIFDTFGDPGVLARNIQRFKVDPSEIKHIVLSHDDWDHITGLWYLVPKCKDIKVYVCPNFKEEIKERIASFGAQVVEVGESIEIKDGIYLSGELLKESDGRKIYEQVVVIRIKDGLAVICGCAHPGIVNIVRQVGESFKTNVRWLIGGFHLKNNTFQSNLDIIKELKSMGIIRIAPMHCTGKVATNLMREEFGQGFIGLKEGESIGL